MQAVEAVGVIVWTASSLRQTRSAWGASDLNPVAPPALRRHFTEEEVEQEQEEEREEEEVVRRRVRAARSLGGPRGERTAAATGMGAR